MSYKKSLQSLLDGIEKYESIIQVFKTVDSAYKINDAIESLCIGNWKVRITERYMWSINTIDDGGEDIYERIEIDSFENFKNSLVVSVTEHLKTVETRNYDHIKDFREKAAIPAAAIVDALTEDVYEDVVYIYRSGKNHGKIAASVEQRKKELLDYAETVAEEWLREHIDTGVKVIYISPYDGIAQELTVDKVTNMGGYILTTFKDSDITSDNFDSIELLETWFLNVKDAKEIYERIGSISYK